MESQQTKNWYDKSYKIALIVPIVLLVFSLMYLANFQHNTGDLIKKDVSLTGGTTITVFDNQAKTSDIQSSLLSKFPDMQIRALSNFRTGEQTGFLVETKAPASELQSALEEFLGYKLNQENSSVEFSGATLSQGFYLQLRSAIIAAFLLMGWVVFTIFGDSRKIKGIALMLTALSFGISLPGLSTVKIIAATAILAGLVLALSEKSKKQKDYLIIFLSMVLTFIFLFLYPAQWLLVPIILILVTLYTMYSIPSIIVILCAFADIVMTLVVVDLLGISLSSAGVIAFLMLIGYSVDTDILLTTRLLSTKDGTINHRLFGAFKTGIMMTLTAIGAVAVSLVIIYSSSETLRQIFTILLIGLFFDVFNTWVTNMSILKMYAEHKENRK